MCFCHCREDGLWGHGQEQDTGVEPTALVQVGDGRGWTRWKQRRGISGWILEGFSQKPVGLVKWSGEGGSERSQG